MGASELIGLIMDQQNFSSQAPVDIQRIYRLIQEIRFRKNIRNKFHKSIFRCSSAFSVKFGLNFLSNLAGGFSWGFGIIYTASDNHPVSTCCNYV
jgi:hypothetical protein